MPRLAVMFVLSAGLLCFGCPGCHAAAKHGSSGPTVPPRPHMVLLPIGPLHADRVGNRLTMAESDGTGQRLTTYHYDEHDRLTRQTSSGPPLDYTASLTSDDGTAYAEVWTPPSRVAVYCLIAFATVTLGALFVPLRLLRSRRPDVGREARRRRTWIQTIALALIPLMVIGPEAALAIHNEALLYQAVAAAAAGQTSQYETTYTYDANGNMTSRTVTNGGSPATDTYIYDAQNRLVAAELNVGEIETIFVSYGYDAAGIRNRVTKNGVTTWHLTDPNRDYAQVLAEHNGSGEVYVRYCYGDDLISQTRGGTTRFYHYDGQLSTRQLTEGTPDHAELGAVRDTYTFDAFGNLLDKTGFTANEYLYTGEQYDPNVGFYYLRARYYAQETGRFTSRDIFGGDVHEPSSLHRYLYANADPADCIDPSGCMALYIQTIAVWTVRIVNFVKCVWPVVRFALAVWDAITVYRILHTGFTRGWGAVSAWDWVQFGLATTGLLGLAPGSKLLVKALIGKLFRIPISAALRTFHGARQAVGQWCELMPMTAAIRQGARQIVGRFYARDGVPFIKYFRTGDDAEDAKTLIHEFLHYVDWRFSGKPTGAMWDAWHETREGFEGATKIYDTIAEFIFELVG